MSHLTLETLARLVDDAPDAAEKAHLEACAACRRELEDLRADLAVLQSLPAIQPPATEWGTIEARLAAEGLLRRPRTGPSLRTTLFRAAAAVLIFTIGGLAGAAWTGAQPGILPGSNVDSRLTGGDVRPLPGYTARGPRTAAAQNVLAATVLTGEMPRTRDETARLLGEAEALYLDVLDRFARMGAASETDDLLARVAALEGISAITRAALDRSPTDPVLNGYHITALAQREATLRQIAATAGGSWF